MGLLPGALMRRTVKINDGHRVFQRLVKWLFLRSLFRDAARFTTGTHSPYWSSMHKSRPTGGRTWLDQDRQAITEIIMQAIYDYGSSHLIRERLVYFHFP